MHFEIVTHCYHYSRLLTYQLSSVVLCPPPKGIKLTVSVYYERDDADTLATLRWFQTQKPRGVIWNFVRTKRRNLLKRAIGRNHAARKTKADWVWFTDADHFFMEDVWARLADAVGEHPILCSSRVRCTHDHATGDDYVARVRRPGIYTVDRSDFMASRYRHAVGASQIVKGDWARKHGYLPGDRSQLPCPPEMDTFRQCHSDIFYRQQMRDVHGLFFEKIFIQNVYRIRHSTQGRDGVVEL